MLEELEVSISSMKIMKSIGEITEPFFLVGYVEERPWWPIQSPNKGRKKKASS